MGLYAYRTKSVADVKINSEMFEKLLREKEECLGTNLTIELEDIDRLIEEETKEDLKRGWIAIKKMFGKDDLIDITIM